MPDRSTTTAVFEKQWLHALALAALLYGADRLARAELHLGWLSRAFGRRGFEIDHFDPRPDMRRFYGSA